MKIITTTANDFVRAEVDEWGWDYVEAKFAEGYEPFLVNGIWVWSKENDVFRILQTNNVSSNTCGTVLHGDRNNLPLRSLTQV